MPVPTTRLHDTVSIPSIGFGVFQIPPDDTQQAVEAALEAGYRHIDTAAAYNNERGVGLAIRALGLPRDEIFVTTKLRNGEQGRGSTTTAYLDSRERLGIGPVDLYLIHWPNPAQGLFIESWHDLEALCASGEVRAIGVSNFLPEHLDPLLAAAEVTPAVNQLEVHPTYQQRDVLAACQQAGIAVEAYSPLGQGADLAHPSVVSIADALDVTPAQVILRWHLQQGRIVIPKTTSPARARENLDVLGFDLTSEQLSTIDAVDGDNRIGNDPRTFSISQIR